MPILEVMSCDDFMAYGEKFREKGKHILIYAKRRNQLVLIPSVSTRPLFTFILSHPSQNEREKVQKWWTHEFWEVENIYWKEDSSLLEHAKVFEIEESE